MEDAFAAQRRFVANASHELRTPLTLSSALLQIVLTDPEPSISAFRATCEAVLASQEQQEELIEALLTLARSQRGLDCREPLDLATIARGVVQARQPDAAHLGLVITASFTPSPVLGDARLVERLVSNLVDNAICHNVTTGRIDIHVSTSGGYPTLKITNTGPVVPTNQVNRLLEPFQRLGSDQDLGDQGLGLGLSIVAAIAKAHRATLTAKPGLYGGLDIIISFPPGASITEAWQRGSAQVEKEA